MKTKIITTLYILILSMSQSCELTQEEFSKITPDNFYKTQADANLAVAALYTMTHGFFHQQASSFLVTGDITAGDMCTGVMGTGWDGTLYHYWTESQAYYVHDQLNNYKHIQNARIVAEEIKNMDIPDNVKNPLIAEAEALAGWIAYILYDWVGPIPYPTDEMLNKPSELNYPSPVSNDDFVKIIENLFSRKEDLMDADFGASFGRMNKGIANIVLMKLYMLEAGRTGDLNFYQKAQLQAEEIINSGKYQLQNNYSDIFSSKNRKNREIIYARPCEPGGPSTMYWHATFLPSNYPCALNRGVGSWGVGHLLWSFYDTFNKDDFRLSTMATSYVTDKGILIDREHPYDMRHGLGLGPVCLKYDIDEATVGNQSHHDYIVYRYTDVLLYMAEILNELGTNANVNAPITQQTAKDGTALQSDGGKSAYSFINAVRIRAGLNPLANDLSKSQLRDSILMERNHELYVEGVRRPDLIRYQRVTNSQGYKKFDPDVNKFLMPVAARFINEYKGNWTQNPGY